MKKSSKGYYRKTIVDPNTKKRIEFNAKSERELMQKIMAYKTKAEKGKTLSEVGTEWWDEHESEIAYQTAYSYKPCLDRILTDYGDLYIRDINSRMIQQMLIEIAKKGFAQKTVITHKLVLNMVFRYAIYNGYVDNNPVESATIPKGLKKSKRTAESPQNEQTILENASVWLYPYFCLLTGLRKGEALALTWEDIDLEQRLITVNKSMYWEVNTPIIKDTKTENGNRLVPIVDRLYDELIKLPHSQGGYLFHNKSDKFAPMTKSGFNNQAKAYEEATGVKLMSHKLRHSFATIGFENGINPGEMQHLLGHASYNTTMDIYTDFRKSQLDELREKMNKAK